MFQRLDNVLVVERAGDKKGFDLPSPAPPQTFKPTNQPFPGEIDPEQLYLQFLISTNLLSTRSAIRSGRSPEALT
jgi:hypothetical protein